jgi:hypothetical protein
MRQHYLLPIRRPWFSSDRLCTKTENPLHGSKDRSSAFYTIRRPSLQKANPLHGTVWGIREARKPRCFRKHLNDPQTAVWVILLLRKPD